MKMARRKKAPAKKKKAPARKTTFDKVQDSGVREDFGTGSVRDTRDGKGRYDLIPPDGLKRLAVHFQNGAKKYGDRNWEIGQPLSRYCDSGIRHFLAYLAGDRSEDHLAAAMWNAMCAAATECRIDEGLIPKEINGVVIDDCGGIEAFYEALTGAQPG
jgi:hypothetical protein